MMTSEWIVYTHRIRYADTDKMGVAYHGRYFEWFEAARTEMMRDMGMAYKTLEDAGLGLPVIEADCRYRRSIFYDEAVRIQTRAEGLTRTRLTLAYRILGPAGDNRIRAEGHTVHAFVNSAGRPTRAPESVMEFFRKSPGLGD